MDTRLPLTDNQQKVYDYLMSGKPRISLRQMSTACDLNGHPHQFVQAVAALLMKGYLEVVPDGLGA